MGKGLLKIRQHLWLPLFESKVPVKLMQLLQLFDVLHVIQSLNQIAGQANAAVAAL